MRDSLLVRLVHWIEERRNPSILTEVFPRFVTEGRYGVHFGKTHLVALKGMETISVRTNGSPPPPALCPVHSILLPREYSSSAFTGHSDLSS